MDIILTKEEVERIYKDEYIKKHIGTYTLNKKYGTDLYFYFHQYDLPLRNNQEKNRKYTCDDTFFDIIDTEEKAYWLGFIYADGYITRNNKSDVLRMGISLKKDDENHLIKFQKAINTDTPIHNYKVSSGYNTNSEYCRIIISYDKVAKDLIKHGCVEHKSNIKQPPIGVPDNLIVHFIRGYFDGNGSITITQKDNNHCIKITSTEAMLTWIQNILLKNNIIKHEYKFKKRKAEQIVSSLDFGGNNLSQKFLDYIYKDATIYLDRKYQRYINLVALNKIKEEKKIKKQCSVCDCNRSDTCIWHYEGEYNDKPVCRRHYGQLLKFGAIQKDIIKKDKCDICNDDNSKLILVGRKYMNYYGMTLCRKHYEQLYIYGTITDSSKGWHKNEQ